MAVEDASEVLPPPRRRTFSFYIMLIFGILPIWSITPLSWFGVLYFLVTGSLGSLGYGGRFLFAWGVIETIFSIYHAYLARHVRRPRSTPPGRLSDIQQQFHRVLQSGIVVYDEDDDPAKRPLTPDQVVIQMDPNDPRAIDFRNRLRTWFHKVPWSHIHKEAWMTWLYWSTFNAPLPKVLSEPQRAALEDAISYLEMRTGTKIKENDGSKRVKTITLTLDPINIIGRPALWYAGVAIANGVLRNWFERSWGGKFVHFGEMEFFLRIPPNWTTDSPYAPIIFLHGLGLGLAQYNILLSHLMKVLPEHPLLLPLQPHISQDILHPRHLDPPTREEAVDAIVEAFSRLGFPPAIFLSHSNGSIMHAWMLKARPDLIARSCFVDPVAFGLHEGDVCYNFLYQSPTTAFELMIRYFVASELGVANLLQRHFEWHANILWLEEVPNARDPTKAAFFTGGLDEIVNTRALKRYLETRGVKSGHWHDPSGRHGEALIRGAEGLNGVVKWLQTPAKV